MANSTAKINAHTMAVMRERRLSDLLGNAERHCRAGHLTRAVFFYRRVLALTQDGEFERELAHARLADVHLGLGQAEWALPHLMKAIWLSGGEPEYGLMLGRVFLALGRAPEALEPLLEGTKSIHSAVAFAWLAEAYADCGDRESARSLAELAQVTAPGRFEGLRARYADA